MRDIQVTGRGKDNLSVKDLHVLTEFYEAVEYVAARYKGTCVHTAFVSTSLLYELKKHRINTYGIKDEFCQRHELVVLGCTFKVMAVVEYNKNFQLFRKNKLVKEG